VEIPWRLQVDRRRGASPPDNSDSAGSDRGGVVCLGPTSGVASPGRCPLGAPVVTTTFGIGTGPMPDVATNSATRMLFNSNAADDSVSVIDIKTRTVTATIEVGDRPGKVGTDPTSGLLYVSNRGQASVSVVDPANPLSSVQFQWETTRTTSHWIFG
jgi:YVTN family beta-propeller protein